MDEAHCRQCDSLWKIPNVFGNEGAVMSLLMPAVMSQQTTFSKHTPFATSLPSVCILLVHTFPLTVSNISTYTTSCKHWSGVISHFKRSNRKEQILTYGEHSLNRCVFAVVGQVSKRAKQIITKTILEAHRLLVPGNSVATGVCGHVSNNRFERGFWDIPLPCASYCLQSWLASLRRENGVSWDDVYDWCFTSSQFITQLTVYFLANKKLHHSWRRYSMDWNQIPCMCAYTALPIKVICWDTKEHVKVI